MQIREAVTYCMVKKYLLNKYWGNYFIPSTAAFDVFCKYPNANLRDAPLLINSPFLNTEVHTHLQKL